MLSFNTWNKPVLERLNGLGLLALRLWCGQEFCLAGIRKLSGGLMPPDWFASLAFPSPLHLLPTTANWLIAGSSEVVFGLALVLGLYTRLASLVLLFVTYVAVYTVHFDLGWMGWNQIETDVGQGFKVPLMLGLMLLATLTQGGGQYALDAIRLRHHGPLPTTQTA